METTIFVTVFGRPRYLEISLDSICRQNLGKIDYEILVINDGIEDETQSIVNSFVTRGFPVKYLFTGQRNVGGLANEGTWRVPGFALNIGFRQTSSDIIVLSNSDVYHLGDTLFPIIKAVENDSKAMGTLGKMHDDFGTLVNYLQKERVPDHRDLQKIITGIKAIPLHERKKAPRADPRDPYCMAIRRKHIEAIGAYDEDFTGYAHEDTDLMRRLQAYGCYYVFTQGEAVHLYHGDRGVKMKKQKAAYDYNLALLLKRNGRCYRNQGQAWGTPDGG